MFPEELKIAEANKLEITLRPRTDLNSSQGIFVFITLVFKLPKVTKGEIFEEKRGRREEERGEIGSEGDGGEVQLLIISRTTPQCHH